MKKQFAFSLIIFFAGLILSASDKQNSQVTIKFSHQFHLKEAELACTDCHENIEESVKATDDNLPNEETCANCHDVEDKSNCTTCHTDMNNLEKFPRPARNFFFNHKKHVTDEKISCDKCHPGMESIDMGLGQKIPAREVCNTCHNGMTATMECFTCHKSSMQLHPANHIPTWLREHEVQVRAGDNSCTHCHTNNYCQQCHEATDLVSTKILPQSFYPSFSPQAKGDQKLVLKSIHDLNYRYTHQLDALGKEKECDVCHETSQYCVECHTNSGKNTQIRPTWHGGADWGAIAMGVGTGGGRHAELARRDIERCAACHDVQSADPTCLQCHTDFDGIRGTDPKTHDAGFNDKFGEDSNFHHDEGAVCFNCHTNTQEPGVGFCGYCHGHE